MADVLAEWGVTAALVHGGFSSVLALEPPPGRDGWDLTLSDPAAPGVLARLSVRQTALGASGVRNRDHIVDPRTGSPVRDRRAAWVTLPRPRGFAVDGVGEREHRAATVADALTTACMLLDHEDVQALCRNGGGLEAWLLEDTQLRHFGID
jgi:thiamine biosynthesis lipoprotein